MQMFKRIITIFVLALFVLSVVSCGQAQKESGIKVAMVTDVGGINDQSFNQSAWEGLKRAEKEFAIAVSYLESTQDADYSPNMETLLDAGNNLIWGIGFKMGDTIKEKALANPDQNYAIIDYAYGEETPANVVGVVFKEQEPSFLVGYIAGKMTKTNKVGFVGGMKFPLIEKFEYGFKAGVKLANPDAEILAQYADSFTDAAKGKAIANQMYENNADIVYHAAGGVGDGVIEAAKEQDKFAIGVDRDQNSLAPEHVITSAMKRVDNAIFNIAALLVKDEFPGGSTVGYGLKEGGVGIAPTSYKLVPAEILEEVEELKAKVISGEIVVPSTPDTFAEWMK
jgi:basic membrane protein A